MIATEGLSVQPAMAGGVVRSGRFWVNAVQPLVSTRQVPGARWYTVVIRGGSVCAEEAGAGFCQDALRAAAELVREVSAIALAHAPHARGLIGQFEVLPDPVLSMPGSVCLTVGLHAATVQVLHHMEASFKASVDALNDGCHVQIALHLSGDTNTAAGSRHLDRI